MPAQKPKPIKLAKSKPSKSSQPAKKSPLPPMPTGEKIRFLVPKAEPAPASKLRACPRCEGSGKRMVPPGIEAICGLCKGNGEILIPDQRFRLGDRVKLTEGANQKYGPGPQQGQGQVGEIVAIRGDDSPDPTRPYLVLWPTHPVPNSYRDEDLMPAKGIFRLIQT